VCSKNSTNFEETFAEARREENDVLISKQQEMRIEKGESDRISKHTKEVIARLAVATRRAMGCSGENDERMEYLEEDYYLKKEQPVRKKKRRTPVERGLREDQKRRSSPELTMELTQSFSHAVPICSVYMQPCCFNPATKYIIPRNIFSIDFELTWRR
jgi:hypothetical protein